MIKNKELIEIYKLTKKDNLESFNTTSEHWKRINDKSKYEIESNLINFRKNEILSYGLDNGPLLNNKIDLMECLNYFDNDFLRKNLPHKNIGKSTYSENFLGFHVDYHTLQLLSYFLDISKSVFPIIKPKNILEFGAGFGGLARMILNNIDTKYILIDLPEACLLTSFYLKEHFPNKKFYLYSDYKNTQTVENLDSYDIFILPPWCKLNESIKIDFFINTRSMQEMNISSIKNYFDLIHKHISEKGFFLNINRYKKQSHLDINKLNEEVNFSDFPYDDKWEVKVSKPTFFEKHAHLLLTQRSDQNLQNIKKELLIIKKSSEELDKNTYNNTWYLTINFLRGRLHRILRFFLLAIFKKKLKKIAKYLYNLK